MTKEILARELTTSELDFVGGGSQTFYQLRYRNQTKWMPDDGKGGLVKGSEVTIGNITYRVTGKKKTVG